MAKVKVRVNRDFVSPVYGDCVVGQEIEMGFDIALTLQSAGVVSIKSEPIETKPAPEVDVQTKPFRAPEVERKDGGDTGERAEPVRSPAKRGRGRARKG